MHSFLANTLNNPRALLLIDAGGAVATSAATYFLLASERLRTGLPFGILNVLALVALSFAIFDIVSLVRAQNLLASLRWIACCNLIYCGVVVALLVIHRTEVTLLGLGYFLAEITIIVPLSLWEWMFASRKWNTRR